MYSTSPARILLADDYPIVRLGIRAMAGSDPTLTLSVEAESADAALRTAKSAALDLALVDLSFEYGTGLDLVRALHKDAPRLPVLVFSGRDEVLFAERSLRAGARGYIMKQEPIERLVGAIRHVLAGQIYLSPRMSQRLLERVGKTATAPEDRLVALTNRELEVLEMIGRGLTTAAIAHRLRLSIKTIETYRSNIKTKLGLKDATELIRCAMTWTEGL
jgi:DNA-binding NarL/FixJ family response regulator